MSCTACCPSLHVHAVRTTGRHAKQRRAYVYAARCQQCGVRVDANSHVASHVLTYPYLNCCVAYLSLQTCCRSCNARHQAKEANACLPLRAAFVGSKRGPHLEPPVFRCCCMVYALPEPPVPPVPPDDPPAGAEAARTCKAPVVTGGPGVRGGGGQMLPSRA